MRPSIATVLSPRPWESRLVQTAADTGLVRLTARCFNPIDIREVAAVVIGSEAPWFDHTRVSMWRARDIAVIGIFAHGDRPAIARLCAANVDQLFLEDTDPVTILRAVRDIVGERASRRLAAAATGPRRPKAI